MTTQKQIKLFINTMTLMSIVALSGCASVNPYTGEQQMSDSTLGAGIGAISGGIAGALLDGQTGALIGGAVGGLAGGGLGRHLDAENNELRQKLLGTSVQVRKSGNRIQLVMASDITFDTDQAAIRSDFYPVLDSVAIVLKKYKETSITVSGYTDNTGSSAHNQVLSEHRAQSVAAYLSSQGISENRLFSMGYGMRNPVASNASALGRAMNRRVEITLRPL